MKFQKNFLIFFILGCSLEESNNCIVWKSENSCGFSCQKETVNCKLDNLNWECKYSNQTSSFSEECPFSEEINCLDEICVKSFPISFIIKSALEEELFSNVKFNHINKSCYLEPDLGELQIECICDSRNETCSCVDKLSLQTYNYFLQMNPCGSVI